MTQHDNHRDPDEIESDIEQTRSRLDDTLNQLEEKFSPRQILNDTYEYVRQGGANDFVTNLGTVIKQNPMPVMLTGIGLGWLIISNSRHDRHHDDHYHHEDSHLGHGSAVNRSSMATHSSPLPSATSPADPSMTTPAAGATDRSATGTIGAGTTSSGTDPTLVGAPTNHSGRHDKGRSRMGATKDKARHMMNNVRDKTSRANGSSTMGSLSHKAQGAGSEVSHFVQEHPLVAGALGIALGAALGGLLPSTRAEDEYLGDKRDKTLDKAASAGQQQAEKAQAKMHEKSETSGADPSRPGASPGHAASPGVTMAPQQSEFAKTGAASQASPPDKPITSSDKPLSSDTHADSSSSTHPRTDPPTRGG